MTFFSPFTYISTLLIGIAIGLPISATARESQDLIAAREAYKNNDIETLTKYANNMSAGPLQWYPAYWLTQKALEQHNDDQVTRFLTIVKEGVTVDRIRREWLKQLGRREDWKRFAAEWLKLPSESRDEETQCYGDILTLQQGDEPKDLSRFLDSRPLAEGCNRLIKLSYDKKFISEEWIWRRIRLLFAGQYTTAAQQLANAAGFTLPILLLKNPKRATPATQAGQEMMVYSILNNAKSDTAGAAHRLSKIQFQLNKAQAGFAWGQLALYAARQLNPTQALVWFNHADPEQLTRDQWEWWARCLLRQQQWNALDTLIQSMPIEIANRPTWLYWRARALKTKNLLPQANLLLIEASKGHHYYALLAQEELGDRLSEPADTDQPNKKDVTAMSDDIAIRRALALFTLAQDDNRPEFRSDAQAEWRWAMRGRSDKELLAAAEIARQYGFYDMAIYSAERTQKEHDFTLRYLTPYRDITKKYAKQLSIDDAWIYGLIRQESRFITIARSGVGASGLMQLMPATARWVARKMGLGNSIAINDIETNIQLGTWYLKHVLDSLSDSLVLATAAYNAGPGRARAWQSDHPLEGAIYVETIPFRETRDYVQKVMANAAWYSSNMGYQYIALKERLGTIPAKQRQVTAVAYRSSKEDK